MSLVTIVSPDTDAIVVTPTAGNGITLHEDGDFALSSDREWHYSTDDVAYGAMVRVAQGEVVSIRRSGSDKSLYLRTRSGAAQIAVEFSAIPTVPAGVPAGGLFGAKTIVVSTTGSDAAGAASKYAAEFLTIQAAITAAAAGDCVLVRPGAYAPTASIIPKTGVPIYFFLGAVVTITAAPGTPTFYDNGATVAMQILGYGKFVSADREQLVQLGASSTLRFECQEIDFSSVGNLNFPLFSGFFGSTKRINVLVRGPCVTTGKFLKSAVDVMIADIECREGLTAGQILTDVDSTGATRISIRSPRITATVGNEYGFDIRAQAGAARYDILAEELIASVYTDSQLATQVHITTGTHVSGGNAISPLRLGACTAFVRTGETRGQNGGGENSAIRTQQNATINLLGGRFVGADGDASGDAITFATDAPRVNVHPGVVLIAGSHASASAVGIAGAAATPTIHLYGDIAANKAVAAGVVEAVGSLLVDAAVA